MRRRPGEVRDAIVRVLDAKASVASVQEITDGVVELIGHVPASSVRSYLRLNTPALFARMDRAQYSLIDSDVPEPARQQQAPALSFRHGRAALYLDECNAWIDRRESNSIHAVVTDPPYGLLEYSDLEQDKLRSGKGGVWRIPPSFDGAKRAPLPRFTVLSPNDHAALEQFFLTWARKLQRALVPGANVVVASNPLLSFLVSGALARAGLERRGEIVRLVMTMRGGDRPKAAHVEFGDVSVMPRSMWEPWLVFRKPLDGRVQDNLRRWGTGGFRRRSSTQPFGDVIESSPTRTSERMLAPHPSLKPQAFMRRLVRGVLPLGIGVVCDPFAGSGSTLAAAEAVGYESVGVERDRRYFEMAKEALPRLAAMKVEPAVAIKSGRGTPSSLLGV
jgi:site-specific DNA-methyltransferase (adenine-specific)